jgi:TfoX/Sxy family transcriptional regulator of competence genes
MEKSPAALVERFKEVVPNDPDIEHRRMFGYPACLINGNMFTGLFESSLFVRLGPEARDNLLQEPGAHLLEPMPGRPMKEYVVVPPAIVDDAERLSPWLKSAADYARSLPPKEKKPKRTNKS